MTSFNNIVNYFELKGYSNIESHKMANKTITKIQTIQMNTLTPSKFNCPICKRHLTLEMEDNKFTVFCAWGRCEDQTANDGAEGDSEQEAFDKLKQKLDEEEKAR